MGPAARRLSPCWPLGPAVLAVSIVGDYWQRDQQHRLSPYWPTTGHRASFTCCLLIGRPLALPTMGPAVQAISIWPITGPAYNGSSRTGYLHLADHWPWVQLHRLSPYWSVAGFVSWLRRLKLCVEKGGGYSEGGKKATSTMRDCKSSRSDIAFTAQLSKYLDQTRHYAVERSRQRKTRGKCT